MEAANDALENERADREAEAAYYRENPEEAPIEVEDRRRTTSRPRPIDRFGP